MSFKKETKIGEGGFGEVWTCRDQTGDLYAMKTVPSTLDDEEKERFAREVRILGSLDHPNVVKVLAKRLNSEPFWYIMPLYQQSLASIIPALVADESRISTIMTGILDGVEYAHLQGILYRDLKADNVLINSDTDLVISDFGLGRIIDSESTRQTISGFGMGTLRYMAPEQFSDAKYADHRSDVFSLGRMIYELYTGPLTGMHQNVTSLPPGIAHIVTRCTRPNADDRFQTVTDLKNAWKSYFSNAMRLAGMGELRELTSQLLTSGQFEKDQLKQLSRLLEQNQGDEDLIQEVLSKLDVRLIRDVWQYNKSGVGLVLKSWWCLSRC